MSTSQPSAQESEQAAVQAKPVNAIEGGASSRFALRSSVIALLVVALAVGAYALLALGHSQPVSISVQTAALPALTASAATSATLTPEQRVMAQAAQSDLIAKAAQARIDAPQKPLSALAQLGQKIFFDTRLSGSGKMSCATCHAPDHAFAPGNELPAQLGGTDGRRQGLRAVPTLTYHEHTIAFAIGPDTSPDEDDNAAIEAASKALKEKLAAGAKVASVAKATRAVAAASDAKALAAVESLVPQGGFDWDGRAVLLSDQAGGPLFDPNEMANTSPTDVVRKLKEAPYAPDMLQLFGPAVFSSPNLALGEAYSALAQFQTEDRRFHPYDSKFDYNLAGRVALTEQEALGKELFDSPNKGNCASCHIDKLAKETLLAPVFTDYQFEALGAPRNTKLAANRNSKFFDEGLCGPLRKDFANQPNYCGLFKTPTLRNVATRKVFYHNGVFTSLEEAVRFYVERETKPSKWYPKSADGRVLKYNDLPAAHSGNVDIKDAPFDRKLGQEPALNDKEIAAIVAFLQTLSDGYTPSK